MKKSKAEYGIVHNPRELGELDRAHRKNLGLPLEQVGGIANLGLRFLSEFERGKETAEIGKIFKALETLGLRQARINTVHQLKIRSFPATIPSQCHSSGEPVMFAGFTQALNSSKVT